MMKFPTPYGIGVVMCNQPVACNYYVLCICRHVLKRGNESLPIQTEEDPREERSCPKPVEDLKRVELEGLEKVVQIGVSLIEKHVKALVLLLIDVKELFA